MPDVRHMNLPPVDYTCNLWSSTGQRERGTGSVPSTPRALAWSRCGWSVVRLASRLRGVSPTTSLESPAPPPVTDVSTPSPRTQCARALPAARRGFASKPPEMRSHTPLRAFLSARLRADEPCARAGASALRRAGERKGTREVAVFRWLARAVRARPLPRHRQRSCARSGRVGWGDAGGEGGAGRGADRGVRGGRSAALGVRAAATTGPDGGSGTAANVFCGPAEHFCVDAEGFCIARGDFCVDAEPFCIDAKHFCIDAEPFCVDAEHFCIDAEHICIDANVSVRGSRKCRCSANAAGSGSEQRRTRGEKS